MALQKVGEKAIIVSKSLDSTSVKQRPKKEILEEEKYVEDLEKIIVRDFYPDLPKLKVQQEYLDALERNDTEKLRQIHIKYGPKRGVQPGKTPDIYSTPATFETPLEQPKSTPKPVDADKPTTHPSGPSSAQAGASRPWTGESGAAAGSSGASRRPWTGESGGGRNPDPEDEPRDATGRFKRKGGPTHNPEAAKERDASVLSLDKYLAKHTSEDNASFGEIMEEADKKHRVKHAWLYDQEKLKTQDLDTQLALPSIGQQAIESGNPTKLQVWKYTAKNAMMYAPEGVELSSKEMIEAQGKKAREIDHSNTRFVEAPFSTKKSAQSILDAKDTRASLLQGKVGVDGKEMLPGTTPKVNGYGFVATPSPAPGMCESPLMTWGEIEGTPFRLDGSDTPHRVQATPGPQFKIPNVPKRDRIGLELAEKASKAHRDKKKQAIDRVRSNFASSPSPQFGAASKTDRLGYLSPAAQRLASSKLGITRTGSDKALRASYTPSPGRLRSGGLGTPLASLKTPTPGGNSSARKSKRAGLVTTPKSGADTPGSARVEAEKREGGNLTDNLLNLPKRQKAHDYF